MPADPDKPIGRLGFLFLILMVPFIGLWDLGMRLAGKRPPRPRRHRHSVAPTREAFIERAGLLVVLPLYAWHYRREIAAVLRDMVADFLPTRAVRNAKVVILLVLAVGVAGAVLTYALSRLVTLID
jgi:hypothetical protein